MLIENVYIAITYLFILLGIAFVADGYMPREYIALTAYFVFKMLTMYDKCTLSYIECKLRKVKKEDGYIYDFLHSIVMLKDTVHAKYFYMVSIIFIIFYTKQAINGNP